MDSKKKKNVYFGPHGAQTCWCQNKWTVVLTQKRLWYWLIDWGVTSFLTISQLYHGCQFTYSCISWFSHTSTPHNNLPKQLAAFPHRLHPLVEDEWRVSLWILSLVWKKVVWAGIQTHNPWIDSPHRYRLSYQGSPKKVVRKGFRTL